VYARIRSAVRSVGERPLAISRIRFGSPIALRPSVDRGMPVLSMNASKRDLKCPSSVFMPQTLKRCSQGGQLVGKTRHSRAFLSVPAVG